VYGAALAQLAEFLSTVPLQKLQQVELQVTRPLSYAEAAAKLLAALLQASHTYVRRSGMLPPLYMGSYEVLERTDK
jgi:hypothetical protein